MAFANPHIFRAYDIRGIYGTDFDADFAREMANKMVSSLDAKIVVIGHDGRGSAGELFNAVLEGVQQAGASVTVLGESTTPVFYHATTLLPADVGIMITASHNPGEYNGLKVVTRTGEIIGGKRLQTIYNETAREKKESGPVECRSFSGSYGEKVLERATLTPGKYPVSLEAGHATRNLLTTLGLDAEIEFQEGSLKAVFDADGDRIALWERGQLIPPDMLFLILVDYFKYTSAVYDFRFSKAVPEYLESHGIKGASSKVGRLYVHENMQSIDAECGAELSGHYYFKDFRYFESPELVLLVVLKILREKGTSLTELVASYQKYARSDEMSMPMSNHANVSALFERLEKKYSYGQIDKRDGLTIDLWDTEGWWFNIRQSHTEPVLRLVVEGRNKELLDQKVAELQK